MGAYHVKGLAIHFGERTVKVVPAGRTVLAHLGPYAEPGHENAEGRVDITNGTSKYFLYRKLTNAGVRSDISYVKGVHNIKAGVTYEHTFLTENDSLGIIDPLLDAVIGLLESEGDPTALGGGLTGIYAQTWDELVKRLAKH